MGGRREAPGVQDEAAGDGGTVPWWLAQRR